MARDEDRRRRRNSIAGDGLSGPEVVLTALLNHRSPGVSPGTWESRGMSPTGYPGYPPRYLSRSSHGATAVVRPHWNVSDKPIARRSQKNFRKRARASRLPFSLIFPVAYALNGPISRRLSPRDVSALVVVGVSAGATPPSTAPATFWSASVK